MEMTKSFWQTSGDNISFSVPFAKVDTEQRMVSGFATLDNIDRTGDICTAEASQAAFERFRGNIREMHQPIAAGRLVAFKQEDFYDATSQKMFRGIFVTAYVSKGAQDTWEKVLDGTLSGFSIGGNITEQESVYDAEQNRTIRVIKEYDLIELSLVDSPANQLANIFSVVKSEQGELVYKGMAFETSVSNVFYCVSDQIAVVSTENNYDCASCNKTMENIGWIESTDTDKSDVIKDVVQKYLNPEPEIIKQAEVNTNEGGIEVSDIATSVEEVEPIEKADAAVEEAVEAVEEAAEVVEVASDDAAAVDAADEVEKADEGSEVEAVDTPADFAKLFDDFKAFVSETVTKSAEASNEQVAGVRASVDEFVKTVNSKFDELGEGHANLTKTVETLSNTLSEVEARVEGINSSTAVKKSAELGGSEDKLEKSNSIWGGRFLGVSDLS
jgi:uncharacterized protein YaaR (DUF327 family)